MAAANVPLTRDLLSRLAAGTAGVVGGAFLRRLVAELGAALNAEVAFVAELIDEQPGSARTIASATAPGIELGEGYEFELAGTPCEHAYTCELLRPRRRGGRAPPPRGRPARPHGRGRGIARPRPPGRRRGAPPHRARPPR